MQSRRLSAKILARAFVAADFEAEAFLLEGKALCGGKQPRWLVRLANHLVAEFSGFRPLEAEIANEICEFTPFQKAWQKGKVKLATFLIQTEPQMRPFQGAPESWNVPPATGFTQLANLLRLHSDDLSWLTSYSVRHRHYHYTWHAKRSATRPSDRRLIEAPKPLLKLAQLAILHRILDLIPVHESAMAFRPQMSVLDFVEPHTQQRLVLKLDLSDFFPSIGFARILQVFLSLGYPESVARVLTRLCTHSVPTEFLQQTAPNLKFETRQRLVSAHLPQGAPTSPALANLAAFRLDCRLNGLANAAGANYTRYADDLLFSGDQEFARQAKRFHIAASAIILSEGFRPNFRKTRFMPSSQRQRAAGLVVNEKPNVSRPEFDRLKAILTNCNRQGPRSQNIENHPEFRSHLQGRIAWFRSSNEARANKLQALFDSIDWSS